MTVFGSTPLPGQQLVFSGHEVAPGIHLFQSPEAGAGNSVAIVSNGRAIVVDGTISPSAARGILDQLDSLGIERVAVLVNTHWHQDHVLGNQVFRDRYPDITIAAHAHTAEDMISIGFPDLASQIAGIRSRIRSDDSLLTADVDRSGAPLDSATRVRSTRRTEMFRNMLGELQAVEPTPPTVTFTDRISWRVGELVVHVIHLGRGHTRGDVVVYVPQRHVVITGDLVTRPMPAAAEGFSYIGEWADALGRLDSLEFDVLVPGHGGVLHDRQYMHDLRTLFDAIVDHAHDALQDGASPASTIETFDASWFVGNYLGDDERATLAFKRFFLNAALTIAYQEAAGRASDQTP